MCCESRGWNAVPPPSPRATFSHTVSPVRTCMPASWNPDATKWLDVGCWEKYVGWRAASPLLHEAKVLVRPACRDTKTPPSQPTHTWRLAAGPASLIDWMSGWMLLPTSPAASAPAPAIGSGGAGAATVEIPLTAASVGPAATSKHQTPPRISPAALRKKLPPR